MKIQVEFEPHQVELLLRLIRYGRERISKQLNQQLQPPAIERFAMEWTTNQLKEIEELLMDNTPLGIGEQS